MSTNMDDWGPVAFADVAEGQTLKFLTRETGFNGRGIYARDGRVTAVTEKTVRVHCDDGTRNGTRAVLRREDWGPRAVLRLIGQEGNAGPGRGPESAAHRAVNRREGEVMTEQSAEQSVKYPECTVELSGSDGNAVAIFRGVRKGLIKHLVAQGWDRGDAVKEGDAFQDEATSGDCDHVLITCHRWVNVV